MLTDVPDDATLVIDEPFGLIAPENSFDVYEEMINRCNALLVGLAGYAFTSNAAMADRISRDLKVGMAGINVVGFDLPETRPGERVAVITLAVCSIVFSSRRQRYAGKPQAPTASNV